MFLAKHMLDLAIDALRSERYTAAAHALLVAFEEIVDAHSAMDGKHFHEQYLADAWQGRIEWMRDHGLLDIWDQLAYLCSDVVKGRVDHTNYMLRLIMDLMDSALDQR